MKINQYICDRCGERILADEVTKVTFSHGRGKFDLRDEEFEFCPKCDEIVIGELKHPQGTRV